MNGYCNELNFRKLFNKRFIYQLDNMLVHFLEDIFGRKLEEELYVECFKSFERDKTDIIIKIGIDRRNISIKSGKNNSIHLETLTSFLDFLKELNCPSELIHIYKGYHLGYDIYGNRMGGKILQELHSSDLTKLNDFFNQDEIRRKAINRFLFNGINSDCNSVDVVIYGTPESFYYATRDQISNYLLMQNDTFLSPHFSSLVLQPWTRNLNYNPKYEYRRGFVQVKWYRLDIVFESIKSAIRLK